MMEQLSHNKTIYLQLKPWARFVIPIALIMVIMYLFLAFQYWQASKEKASLGSEISELSNLALVAGPSAEALSEELTMQQDLLTEYKAKLNPVSPHILLEELFTESSLSNVGLRSVIFGDQREVVSDNTTFLVQPVALVLQGPWDNLRLFLNGMQDRRPALSAGDIHISDLNTTPSIQLQLAFYLSAEEKEGSDGKSAKVAPK